MTYPSRRTACTARCRLAAESCWADRSDKEAAISTGLMRCYGGNEIIPGSKHTRPTAACKVVIAGTGDGSGTVGPVGHEDRCRRRPCRSNNQAAIRWDRAGASDTPRRGYTRNRGLLVPPERLVGFTSRVRHAAHNISVTWKVVLNLPHREARATRKVPASAPADWSGPCLLQPGCHGMRLSGIRDRLRGRTAGTASRPPASAWPD